jgi:hypothetical protein
MSAELEALLEVVRSPGDSAPDFSPLYQFFSRVIQRDIRITITPRIRGNLGFLSTADRGILWPLAIRTFSNYEPWMLVPGLDITSRSLAPVHPSRVPDLPPQSPDLPTSLPTSPRYKSRKVRLVPLTTTREILPTLAALPPNAFFYCNRKKKSRDQPSALTYNIHRKRLPPIPLTPDTRTISINGLTYCSPTAVGEFTPIKTFLLNKEKLFIASVLPVFRNWCQNKAFVKWLYKLKMKQYRRTQGIVSNGCPFGHAEFVEMFVEIRQFVFGVFAQCRCIDADKPSSTFEQLTENSNERLADMRNKLTEMNRMLAEKLVHFCAQVRNIALLLRSDYQVLKAMGAIPKSLVPYVIEHEVGAPSLATCRIRSQLLFKERKQSYDRKVYLPRFFIMVKLTMRKFIIEQLYATLNQFYFRFTEVPPTTAHRIQFLLHREKGLELSPSLDEFLVWFTQVETTIRSLFLAEHTTLPPKAADLLFPEHDCPDIIFIEDMCLCPEIDLMREEAIKTIRDAYAHFASKSENGALFVKNLQDRVVELNHIHEFPDSTHFVAVADEIADLLNGINALQRVMNFGSLLTDLKPAKTSALEGIRETMDQIGNIGLARSKELFWQITQVKDTYVKAISMNRMMNVNEDTPDILEAKEQIQNLSATYIPITESIMIHWSDSAVEIEEQYGTVQDILALVSPATRAKERKRKMVGKRMVRRRTGR